MVEPLRQAFNGLGDQNFAPTAGSRIIATKAARPRHGHTKGPCTVPQREFFCQVFHTDPLQRDRHYVKFPVPLSSGHSPASKLRNDQPSPRPQQTPPDRYPTAASDKGFFGSGERHFRQNRG